MNDLIVSARARRWISILSLLLLVALPPRSSGQQSPRSAKSPGDSATPPAAAKPFHEDLTALTLEHSTLVMERPVLAMRDDTPNKSFIREFYQVNWRPKDPFDLYVIRPRGVKNPPVILYLYSFPEDTDSFKNVDWCETAVRGGYAAVGFVGAVTAHRSRYRPPKEWFVSEMQEALASSTHDVQLILDHLATRGDLDMNHVAMLGTGSGGAIAVLASAVDPRISVVDLLGPWGDWPEWLAESKIVPDNERADYLKPEFLAKVAPLDPVVWLPKIKAKSVRIQDVRGNKSMPDKSQEKLESAAPDFALINEFGNGRSFLSVQAPITLFDWMKDQLKPDAKPQVAAEASQRIHFFPPVEAPPTDAWPNVANPQATKPLAPAKEKEKDSPR